jgi:octaprenyl-diphosphate synthase
MQYLEILEKDLAEVTEVQKKEISDSYSALIFKIFDYIANSQGKRLRPILTIIAARIEGHNDNDKKHYELAAAVEFIHVATLLHDDVIDEGEMRRGKETVNLKWNNKSSILMGDYLFSMAFRLMTDSGSLQVLKIVSNASRRVVDGEILQLSKFKNINLTFADYLEVISLKTAKLFSAALEAGSTLGAGNGAAKFVKNLGNFGNYIGIAFQIMDDYLDYAADSKKLGKNIGDDFAERKITLPIIFLYKDANAEDKKKITNIFNNKEDDFCELMNLIKKYQSLEKTLQEAKKYQEMSLKELHTIPQSKNLEILEKIAESCVNREK